MRRLVIATNQLPPRCPLDDEIPSHGGCRTAVTRPLPILEKKIDEPAPSLNLVLHGAPGYAIFRGLNYKLCNGKLGCEDDMQAFRKKPKRPKVRSTLAQIREPISGSGFMRYFLLFDSTDSARLFEESISPKKPKTNSKREAGSGTSVT